MANTASLIRHWYHQCYLWQTQTPRPDYPMPSTKEKKIASLTQDAYSAGLVLPSAACLWLSLASQRTGGTLSGHFSLNISYFFLKSLWPCSATTELLLIVGLAALGVSCSAGQHLDILYCLYLLLLCTMGFPHLLSKAQCYLFFVPMQPEVPSSPLTLVFMWQIPHEEKQRREWSGTGECNKGTEYLGGLLFNTISSSVCHYSAFTPAGCFPRPLPCHSEGGGLL